ncbi:MAG: translation initiation factor IF-2 [Planctomycetota bacterium]|nr:translation initiation factor IF-2 [Planctomycetota bacterium]
MARRVFEIAKDLGVDSKAIVAKCHAEGIPEATVKNHMSTISAGLEQTIREWFSTGAGTATAVETSEKVDIDAVRKRAPSRRRAPVRVEPGATPEHRDTDTTEDEYAPAVEASGAAPAAAPAAGLAVADAPHVTEPASAPRHAPAPVHAGDSGVEVQPASAGPVVEDHGSVSVQTPAPVAAAPAAPVSAPPAAPVVAPPPSTNADAATQVQAPKPPAPAATPPGAGPMRATVSPPRPVPAPPPARVVPPPSEQRPAQPPSGGEGSRPGGGPAPMPVRPPLPVRPAASGPGQGPGPAAAPMNVPRRPTVVTPAGPRLQQPTAVKLSGPKVVRIEQAEQVEAPRARRPVAPSGPMRPMGPRQGGGAGGPAVEDDRNRTPRRGEPGKRPTGGGVPERRRGRTGDWTGPPQGVFSEQDLIEREARLARAGGFLKKRKQDLKKPGQGTANVGPAEGRVRISAPFTIKDLSETTGVKASEIVKKLFLQGLMKKINDPIEVEKAVEIMMDFDVDLEVVEARTAEETVSDQFLQREVRDLRARGPVVTILGHVDHGKTSLLDKIRNTNVAAGEAGGITQKTSAFVAEVEVEGQNRQVVFLDTPGHEAFTSMRARGAKMTDVVVLVVSAPEGVMPQTVESINHARAAKVPMVVALNKVDRPDATESQIQKTLGELAKAGVNPVEWGGDTEVVRVSAVTGQGITQLLETLDYQAQLLELKADFDGAAQGTVVEAKMEEGRGAVANIMIQQGRLKVGDFIVMGRAFGRVRDITDDKGKRIKEAEPPKPVQVSGLDLVCDAGDKFFVTRSLREAEDAAEQRRQRERETQLAQPKLTLDSLFSQIQTQETSSKEIRIILKTDQQGTVDVLKSECEKIKSEEVRVRVLHAAVGGIMESDVTLGDASRAIIIGFNVIPSGKARAMAEQKGVEIRTYQVIYDITDDLKKAAEGMLAPELREEVLGHAEVRAVFKVTKVGNVAGCYVTDGTVQRDALIRVTRSGIVIEHDRKLSQLKRVKDDAKEVRAGMECGMKIDGYDDIKEGDVLECYRKVEVKRSL